MSRDSYVYIIAESGGQCVKVGVADNPWARAQCLQTGNPKKLVVIFAFLTPSKTCARAFEQSFHTTMSEHRVSGEWFDMSAYTALVIMCAVIKRGVAAANDFDDRQMALCMEKMGVDEALAMADAIPYPPVAAEALH